MTDQKEVAIVFTGRQGAGKSVLSRALKNALQGAGIKVRSSNGPHPNYEDTLIVETTHDQRCYLSTGAQVNVDQGVVVPRSVLIGWAREFEEREGGNEGEDCVTPFDAYLYGRDKATAGVTIFDQDRYDGSRATAKTDDQTIASIHSIIAQYEDQPAEMRGPVQIETALQAIAALTQKFLPKPEKPKRVDPQDNPNGQAHVYFSIPENAHRCSWGVPDFSPEEILSVGLETLCGVTHAASLNAGWYTNPATGERLERNVPEMLMLIVSEIAEGMEGYRKGLMDDHLPDRLSVEVELADAVIRIGDLCGFLGLDLAGAVIEKMAYNAKREDHKLENRAKGGKAF